MEGKTQNNINLLAQTENSIQNQEPNNKIDQLAVMHSSSMEWTQTPSKTVTRKRLECKGAYEAGRVTSVVKYEAGSSFPEHPHPSGEEILVLEGVFSDQTGHHKQGSYLLNPEGFRHAPFSENGCLLFVKLKQYGGEGRSTERVDTEEMEFQYENTMYGIENVGEKVLYKKQDQKETMSVEKFGKNGQFFDLEYENGAEYFVIEGKIQFGKKGDGEGEGLLEKGSWVRVPGGCKHDFVGLEEDCIMYVKRNHLKEE